MTTKTVLFAWRSLRMSTSAWFLRGAAIFITELALTCG
ncbi:hypothetical protein LINGRAHAP2_LOCUS5849 [Linum grandiflorum]